MDWDDVKDKAFLVCKSENGEAFQAWWPLPEPYRCITGVEGTGYGERAN